MGQATGIAWTDHTWNPWQGCRKVSQGCKHCYMYTEKSRYGQEPGTVIRSKDTTFYAPLKWERQAAAAGEQRKVFTCSWSDFFIEEADPWRNEAFAIMAMTPHLTYQVLTKRPERMLEYFTGLPPHGQNSTRRPMSFQECPCRACTVGRAASAFLMKKSGNQWASDTKGLRSVRTWPLPNVWLGVSVEDQAAADARIPLLLKTPAAVRFLSMEPLLEQTMIETYLGPLPEDEDGAPYPGHISWVICGGESGAKARPCNLAWLRSVVAQCQAAGVACFVKQLGAQPFDGGPDDDAVYPILYLKDRKGADPAEWPEDLRVQEFPVAQEARR